MAVMVEVEVEGVTLTEGPHLKDLLSLTPGAEAEAEVELGAEVEGHQTADC